MDQIEETKKRQLEQQIETLIDRHTVAKLLEVMAQVCFEKSDHIKENWQDARLAKFWEMNAKTLTKIIPRIYT